MNVINPKCKKIWFFQLKKRKVIIINIVSVMIFHWLFLIKVYFSINIPLTDNASIFSYKQKKSSFFLFLLPDHFQMKIIKLKVIDNFLSSIQVIFLFFFFNIILSNESKLKHIIFIRSFCTNRIVSYGCVCPSWLFLKWLPFCIGLYFLKIQTIYNYKIKL